MKCINCSRIIPENSLFCNWCGHKQLKEKKKTVTVPEPKQLPSGAFRIQLMVDGHRQSITKDSAEECRAAALAMKHGLIEQSKTAPRITLGAAIDNYIDSRTGVLSASTVRGYRMIRAHRFQNYMDRSLTSVPYQRMVNEESSLCSAHTLKNAWGLVAAVLKDNAVEFTPVRLAAVPRTSRPWLTPEEIKQFIPLILNQPTAALPALLALHSLRRSEVFGLTWNDIDLEHDLIHVHAASVIGPEGRVDKATTKNASSTRTVRILIPELKQLLLSADHREGPVVTCHIASPKRAIDNVCRSNGLPPVGMHGLRHSFASLCYHLRIPELQAMSMGGWSDFNTLRGIYTHLSQRDLNDSTQSLKDFFSS